MAKALNAELDKLGVIATVIEPGNSGPIPWRLLECSDDRSASHRRLPGDVGACLQQPEPIVGRRCAPDSCCESMFSLATVRDVFSRRIVGWKTPDRRDTDLNPRCVRVHPLLRLHAAVELENGPHQAAVSGRPLVGSVKTTPGVSGIRPRVSAAAIR